MSMYISSIKIQQLYLQFTNNTNIKTENILYRVLLPSFHKSKKSCKTKKYMRGTLPFFMYVMLMPMYLFNIKIQYLYLHFIHIQAKCVQRALLFFCVPVMLMPMYLFSARSFSSCLKNRIIIVFAHKNYKTLIGIVIYSLPKQNVVEVPPLVLKTKIIFMIPTMLNSF